MKHSKKSGSVLLVVVGMFAVLSVITISVITSVMGSYKLTRTSNERIEKFYSADSGLEIAYNKTIEVVQNAIDRGYEKVEEIKKGETLLDINRDVVDTTKEGWENEVFQKEYKQYLENNLEIAIDNVSHNSLIYDEFARGEEIIKVEADLHEVIIKEEKENIPLHLKSKFTSKDQKEREVEVDYDIKVPNYGIKEILEDVKGNSNIFDYIFAADGNLDIELAASFNVLGDMWVKGGELRDDEDLLSKGILVSEKHVNSKIEWHGDIATNGTLDLDDIGIDIPRDNNKNYNIYANDFRYVGDPDKKRYLFSSRVLGDEDVQNNYGANLHLYNDFIFNGTNTHVNLKNFYGLNDITSDELETKNPKVASSMIIESEDIGDLESEKNSQINIAGETMILGTAYLNLALNPVNNNDFFKTGESIVINRQSSPYTYRNYTEKEYLYKYKDKFHMVDKLYKNGDYTELTITDKVELVREFYKNELKNPSVENDILDVANGINLNEEKVFTTGVAYDEGNIVKGDNEEVFGIVGEKRKKYAKEVYLMRNGDVTEDDFAKKEVQSTVSSNFNWEAIEKLVQGGNILDVDKKTVLFEKDVDTHNLRNGGTIFRGVSEKVVGSTILGDYIGIFPTTDKINLVFNHTDNELVLRHNQPFEDNEKEDGKIYINLDLVNTHNMTPTLIISKGPVTLEKKSGVGSGFMEFTALVYTAGDLKFDIDDGPCNVGNYAAKDSKLNELFKKFFAEDGLGNIILGDIIGSTKFESFEKIVNAEDLIEKGKWKLTK
ncbi:MAG: pilus assembly PilX N-terminal domain-containing protein [Sarcina sp.]